MKVALLVPIFSAVLTAHPAIAHDTHKKPHSATSSHGAHGAAMAEGEVRKVDKEAKKITLKHGPISNLDMPAMTMVFQVADPAMLDQVKAGDKVKFSADKAGIGYAVTHIVQDK
jgi:Cu/Ag efflux protein CusF